MLVITVGYLMKELVASYIASRIQDGQLVGLGSGSTAELTILKIGERVKKEGLKVRALTTSIRGAMLASDAGISVLDLTSDLKPDFAFDGADEVDPDLRLIKGNGAAIVREKIVSRRSGGFTVIVTAEKLVMKLGEKFAVPVEILPAALPDVRAALKKFSPVEVTLRSGTGKFGPIITDSGGLILDVRFTPGIAADMEQRLKQITGVVETGIFTSDAKEVIVAKDGALFRFERGGKLSPIQ